LGEGGGGRALRQVSRPSEMAFLESFLPNISILPNNEGKYYYLQFNVSTKIEKIVEIWSLQIVRKGIWPCPPLPRGPTTSLVGRLLILIQSIEFTFSCPENYLHLPENLLEIYLK
jgi:hypothetical protein